MYLRFTQFFLEKNTDRKINVKKGLKQQLQQVIKLIINYLVEFYYHYRKHKTTKYRLKKHSYHLCLYLTLACS